MPAVVEQPVELAALRALVEHSLYRGPERRSGLRAMIGADVKVKASEGLTDWPETLTNRQYEVLLLLEKRQSNKEISDQLYISLETVKTHTKNIRAKLNVNSRRDAVSKAIALKIL